MKAVGFDDCIVGECSKTGRKIYEGEKMIEKLSEQMTREEAIEYFYFNIECAYLGEETPIYMIRKEEEE